LDSSTGGVGTCDSEETATPAKAPNLAAIAAAALALASNSLGIEVPGGPGGGGGTEGGANGLNESAGGEIGRGESSGSCVIDISGRNKLASSSNSTGG
jgi:hypothetical protein